MSLQSAVISVASNDEHGISSKQSISFTAYEALPMPVLVLSPSKKVLVASHALAKLFAWPPDILNGPKSNTKYPEARSMVGTPLNELGIEVIQHHNSMGIGSSLDEILDGLADEFEQTGNLQTSDTEITNSNDSYSTANGSLIDTDSTEYAEWPEEDWSLGPNINLLTKVQRRVPHSKPFKAMITARVWRAENETLFLMTMSKPTPTKSTRRKTASGEISESAKVARRLLKREILAKMKRALFNNMQMPCYFFSPDETMYYPNEAGKQLTGQLAEDYMFEQGRAILGRIELWDEHFTRKLPVDEFPITQIVRTRQNIENKRYGFVDAQTGGRVRLDLSGSCLYDEYTGEFLGGFLFCRDVTEYTEVIAQQRIEIDRGFENKLDNMPNLMFTSHPWPSGEADYFSKQWYEYTGHPEKYDPVLTWREAVHPDDAEVLWKNWAHAAERGLDFEAEARYKRYDGAYRYHLVRAVPQRNSNGEIVKWHGSFVDIHDLVVKRIEARRRKDQMIAVLSHAEVNLFALNDKMELTMLEGNVNWGPDGMHTQRDLQNMVGTGLTDVLDSTTISGTSGAGDLIAKFQGILSGHLEMEMFEHQIDDRWYRTRMIPDIDFSETGSTSIAGILGLSIDITDLKARTALEIERTQLLANEEAAQEANRLKSQFLANVSHELRTPIAGVLGMADLLAETKLDLEQKEYARAIQQSADSLLTIVNDILDFSKIESGRFDIEEVQFDLPSVLSDLSKLMGYAAQRKDLSLEYKTNLQRNEQVIGDPGRVRQILMNLLTNAIKFTSNGSVTMLVSARESGNLIQCVFSVEDTGIGIRPEVLRKLFRPFSQGDSSTQRLFGGTGLGLTICKELATLMKGEIALESVPGCGTKATLSLPFRRPPIRLPSMDESLATFHPDSPRLSPKLHHSSPRVDLNARPLRRPSPTIEEGTVPLPDVSPSIRNRTCVLVVEDNAINQNIAMKLVKNMGFQARAVWNGEECLEYLLQPSEKRPRPSIILMDCQMPVMDGYEATRKIRKDELLSQAYKNVPIIALTASAIIGDREKCKAAGMDDYVTKPVSKHDLERALVKWTYQRVLAGI